MPRQQCCAPQTPEAVRSCSARTHTTQWWRRVQSIHPILAGVVSRAPKRALVDPPTSLPGASPQRRRCSLSSNDHSASTPIGGESHGLFVRHLQNWLNSELSHYVDKRDYREWTSRRSCRRTCTSAASHLSALSNWLAILPVQSHLFAKSPARDFFARILNAHRCQILASWRRISRL